MTGTGTDTGAVRAAAADRTARLAFAVLLLGAVGIAFAPIFVRLSEAGPTATAFWRVLLAAPVLWLAVAATGRRAARAEPAAQAAQAAQAPRLWPLLLPGVFFAGDLAFWHWSIRFTSVANATLLANFAPIFVTLGAWLLFGERFTRSFLVGGAVALTGAVVLMSDSLSFGPEHLLGDALGLVTAVFYGAYILSIGRVRAHFSTLTVMAWSTAVTAVVLLPVALLSGMSGETFFPATTAGWLVLVALAWVSHAGGQGMIAYALAHLPAAFSSVSLLLQPVTAALLAWVLLAEPLGPVQALGGAVVLTGVLVARHGALVRVQPTATR